MNRSGAFAEEVARQAREARMTIADALSRGDTELVDLLRGRLADLQELADRNGLASSSAAV